MQIDKSNNNNNNNNSDYKQIKMKKKQQLKKFNDSGDDCKVKSKK